MNALQKQRIHELRSQGASYAKVADSLGVSINTIKSYCRRNNIGGNLPVTDLNKTNGLFYCKHCGKEIIQQKGRKARKFCSDDCCAAWWKCNPDKLGKKAVYAFTCTHCGFEFTAYGNKGRKFCTHACYVANRFSKAVVT